MSEAYTGGCACGAIRYEIAGEPVFMNDCQCRDCQRTSGAGHGSYLTFASRAHVKLAGEAKHRDIVADSGNVKSYAFCPDCGSPVYLTFAAMPELFTVHAASLDDPARYKPQAVTYAGRGHAWDRLDPALPKFDRMPPMSRAAVSDPAWFCDAPGAHLRRISGKIGRLTASACGAMLRAVSTDCGRDRPAARVTVGRRRRSNRPRKLSGKRTARFRKLWKAGRPICGQAPPKE